MSEEEKKQIEIETVEEDNSVSESPEEELVEENTEEETETSEEVVEEKKPWKRESREERFAREAQEKLDNWVPKTQLGRDVRAGKIKNIDEIFEKGLKIMEPEIVDLLIPNLKNDLLFVGQAKGKFGGGKRRAWRQTQKKTKEGNILTFGVMAVVGDENGHLGIGYGRAAETLPAREKALRKAKLNIRKVARGCGSFDDISEDLHSIPGKTEGKCSSVTVRLMPAPHGAGLVAGDELKKILKLAGIQNIYSKTSGKTRTTLNTAKACVDALDKLGEIVL